MNGPTDLHKTPTPRLAAPPASVLRSLAWIGPMLLLLGTAIGSGELLAEPAAGARYGGSLFWAILFIILTKAFWNEAIGRVSIVTGQNFLECCSGGDRLVAWVPWAYRRGLAWTLAMFLVGGLYLALGTFYVLYLLVAS